MKAKQLQYKSEIKPSFFVALGYRRRSLIGYLIDAIAVYKERLPVWKNAIKTRECFLNDSKKYKGQMIKTEISKVEVHYGRFDSREAFEYRAVIEYKNDEGKIVRFVTEPLNGNPEYVNDKSVTVYNMGEANYATDFGYISKPKESIWGNLNN